MKVVVFGATGFIGQNLCGRLKRSGVDFLACDVARPDGGFENFMLVDITNRDQVEASLKGCSHVVFLVAHPLPDSLVDPKRNFEVNLGGLLNVLDVLGKGRSGKLVFASASSVYGDPPSGAVPEETACHPLTPYAVSKYASEHYLRVFKELYGVDYVIFRLFNVYGPGQLPKTKALIPRVLNLIMSGSEVELFGDGSQSRDFIFVDDVAAHFEAALRGNVSGEIVNLGTGRLTSIAEIVRMCGHLIGRTPKVRRLAPRPGEISNFYADTTKLHSLFKIEADTTILDGLRKTYSWLSTVTET
jgi:nucleoside-diphosphate-sugar epimerase